MADAQGGVPVVTLTGTSGDRMDSETAKVREQLKAEGLVAIGCDRTFYPSWKPGSLDWTN